MKTKIFVLSCIICVLSSLILTDTAIPANGNDPVIIDSITYQVSNRTLSIIITLEPPVAGASVKVSIRFGGVSHAIVGGGKWVKNITTGSDGKATIVIRNAEIGEAYQIRVDKVVASGYTWDGITPDNGYNGDKQPKDTFFPVEGIMFP